MRLAGWLFLFLATLLTAKVLIGQPQDAKATLEAVARRYQGAKTLVLTGTVVNVTRSPQHEVTVTNRFTVHIQRPNRFRVVVEVALPQGGKQRQLFVADGRFLFVEYPHLKQVLKRPLASKNASLPVPFAAFWHTDTLLARIKEAHIEGKETVQGRPAQRIRVVTTDGTVAQIWVADNIIWQVCATVDGKRLVRQTPTKSDQPNPFIEAMKQTTFTTTIKFGRVNFNVSLPAGMFAYKPPVGFKVVEALQMPSNAMAPLPSSSAKP